MVDYEEDFTQTHPDHAGSLPHLIASREITGHWKLTKSWTNIFCKDSFKLQLQLWFEDVLELNETNYTNETNDIKETN